MNCPGKAGAWADMGGLSNHAVMINARTRVYYSKVTNLSIGVNHRAGHNGDAASERR
jgi:hypothetical protein